jgi:hypothetical protein
MSRLEDWLEILAPYAGREETVTLSVSEVTRLVFDMHKVQEELQEKELTTCP